MRPMIAFQMRIIKKTGNIKDKGVSIREKFHRAAGRVREYRLLRFAMTREVGYFLSCLTLESCSIAWVVDLEGVQH